MRRPATTRPAPAIEGWERAYAAHRRGGDHVGAIRVARTLACMHGMIAGNWAVASGWIARAQTLLAGASESSERGWVALNIGMFDSDRARKEQCFREALDVARRHGDTDLEFVTLAYHGASLVHGDRTEEGMVLLDEALAAVAGSEVDDFCVLEEIFCQLFAACEHAHDVTRAEQWIRIGETIAQRRRLPAVSAFCRTHYGSVLTAAGRWAEADVALTEAVRLWGLGQRSALRRGALVRLADLRARQGRVEEAEQLLSGIDVDAEPEAARPLAETAAEQLAACAARHGTDYLIGVAALARGRVCLAAGTGDPQACLREALAGFVRARMPVEVARSRLELATVLTERPEVAMAEARAALDATHGSPEPSGPRRITRSQSSNGRTTHTGAACRSMASKPSSVPTADGRRCRPTTD